MPVDRRNLIKSAAFAGGFLASASARAAPDPDGYPRIMQGPRVGWTGPDIATIWLRLSDVHDVQVEFAAEPTFEQVRRSAVQRSLAEQDYTVVLTMEGLRPGEQVHYRVLIDGAPTVVDRGRKSWFTHAAPARDHMGTIRIAFGSCARYAVSPVQPVWNGVAECRPDLFLWLGDNIYGDALRTDALREEYRRQLSVPNLVPLQSRVSQLAIWDDHDFGLNDHDRTNPIKEGALAAFRDYWANPAYGTEDAPGVFYRHAFGPIDLFMLDNRYHRSPADEPDGPEKTALGKVQRDWLLTGLAESRAPFKIVASGQGWTDAKAIGEESWSSYRHERNQIVRFIREHAIGGVIFLSGDTHVAELNALTDPDGRYDLIECVSSPLAQDTAMSWLNYAPIERIRQVYAGGPNFGMLEFDFAEADPSVRITVRNMWGEPVWTPLDLMASDLSSSGTRALDWMDTASRRRWDRYRREGVYYG